MINYFEVGILEPDRILKKNQVPVCLVKVEGHTLNELR